MMKCDDCIYAEWERTKTGRLHPSKDGKCKRFEKHPLDLRLPAAFYWPGGPPRPAGGYIKRGEDIENCVFKDPGPRR